MPRRIAAVLVVTLLLAAPVLARRDQVPLETRGSVLIVEASINQRVTGRFLLDTGASVCVVSKDTADEAGLSGRKDGQKIQMTTASGARVEATLGEARRIDVGNMVARDVPVAVAPIPFPGLSGVIGLSFLRNFKYSIDHQRGVLQLEND